MGEGALLPCPSKSERGEVQPLRVVVTRFHSRK